MSSRNLRMHSPTPRYCHRNRPGGSRRRRRVRPRRRIPDGHMCHAGWVLDLCLRMTREFLSRAARSRQSLDATRRASRSLFLPLPDCGPPPGPAASRPDKYDATCATSSVAMLRLMFECSRRTTRRTSTMRKSELAAIKTLAGQAKKSTTSRPGPRRVHCKIRATRGHILSLQASALRPQAA